MCGWERKRKPANRLTHLIWKLFRCCGFVKAVGLTIKHWDAVKRRASRGPPTSPGLGIHSPSEALFFTLHLHLNSSKLRSSSPSLPHGLWWVLSSSGESSPICIFAVVRWRVEGNWQASISVLLGPAGLRKQTWQLYSQTTWQMQKNEVRVLHGHSIFLCHI